MNSDLPEIGKSLLTAEAEEPLVRTDFKFNFETADCKHR
jgi:hypothetical protein